MGLALLIFIILFIGIFSLAAKISAYIGLVALVGYIIYKLLRRRRV